MTAESLLLTLGLHFSGAYIDHQGEIYVGDMSVLETRAMAEEIVSQAEDPLLILLLIQKESHFKKFSKNKKTRALGLMQVLRGPITKNYNNLSDRELMDVRLNVRLGMSVLTSWRDFCRIKNPRYYLSVYGGFGSCRSSHYSRELLQKRKRLGRMISRREGRMI